MNKVIFIIGMHRCGTSLLANCLVENGFSVGKAESKVKDWQNPKGYFENDSFTRLHNNLLSYNGCSWSNIVKDKMEYTQEHVDIYRIALKKEFGDNDRILIKDPRLTYFTDFIEDVCGSLYKYHLIFCTRNKKDCCTSLSKAQNISYKSAEKLYDLIHEYYSEEFLKVDHKDIVYANDEVLSKISNFCNFELKTYTNHIVDLSLHRNNYLG